MNSQKENLNSHKGDRSDSDSKSNPEQNNISGKKQSDMKEDSNKKSSVATPQKSNVKK